MKEHKNRIADQIMTAKEFKKMMMDVLMNTSLDETCEFLDVIEETGKAYSKTQTSKWVDQFHQICAEVLELIEGGKFSNIKIIPNKDGSITKYEYDEDTSMSYAMKFKLDGKKYSFDLSSLVPWGWYNIEEYFDVQIYAEDDDYLSCLENIHNAIVSQFPLHEYNKSDGYIEIPCNKENFSSNALDVLNILNDLSK